MTKVYSAPTRLEAWLLACEHLLEVERELNLILSVDSPRSDGVAAQTARKYVDAFYAAEGADPIHTIAESIFPGWAYRRRGLHGMFDAYLEEYELLSRGQPQRWGTYAHRLLSRQTAAGETVNPLDTLIQKMQSEHQQQGRRPLRSCYEIGITEGEYDLPLYNSVDDQRLRRGLPCLSHLSFKLYDGCVHLTAVYRSHDYRYKVLGNLLGLARLQACVAKEVGVSMGTLVVHSTYAYMDIGRGKGKLRNLLTDLRRLLSEVTDDPHRQHSSGTES